MRWALGSFLCVSFAATLHAQATPQSGLLPDWDIRVVLEEISAHAGRLQPMLVKIDTTAWVAKGASETYAAQLQSSKDQARAIGDAAKALEQNPEKLSTCLELYFRITGMEDMLVSLEDGIRRYQDPKSADSLAALAAENGANRNRFQTYIVNLASQREQECAVMDQEAQRCRAVMATQPPPASGATRKGGSRK